MSGILLRWLNEDLRLKQRVLNLDHDFSNGYLLGEVLHVHNHQHDFHLFQDSSTAEARATNFILLEPPLRLLDVRFDVQVAYNIMNGKPGMAGKLLYQVKMVLDRLTKFSVPVSMRPTITPAGVKPLPNLPQRTAKPQYDRATHAIFAAAVRDMVQGKRGSTLERSLQRFEAEGARQKRLVQIEKERSVLAEELHTEAIRVQGIHKLAQRKALCNSWEATNVDSWLMNMGLKRNRELRNHLFRQTVVKSRLERVEKSRMLARTAVQVDIPDFEARSKEAARAVSGNQEEHEATPWAFTALTQGFLEARALESGYEWQMEKFHAKRSGERTEAKKKRRRRYTTEREESLSNDHLKEGMDVLKQKLMKRCRAEELVDRQLESVFRYKAIMTENRKYRKQQYTMRADVDAEGLLKRDQASLDSDRRDYELSVRSQAERCDTARATRVVSAATRVEQMCRETLEGVLALSMEVVSYRVYSEHRREPDATAPQQDPMPILQWTDMKWSFVRGGPLLRMDNSATVATRVWGCTPLLPIAVDEGGNNTFWASHADDETAEKVASFLDACEFEDYINEAGWWATQREPLLLVSKTADGVTSVADAAQADPVAHEVAHEGHIEITDEDEAGATNLLAQSDSTELVETAGDDNVLNTANPLHALGECVIETSLAANPMRAPEPPPAVPKFSMRLCMCGKTLTGKSEQAIRLADRYCLKVLSAEELAQRALDNAANAMAAGRKTFSREEALGQEASSALLQGGTISDKVYAALLVESIKDIEEDNRSSRAELRSIRGGQGQGSSPDDDRTEYMGWVIDDFPGNAEQAAVLEKHLSGYDECAHVSSRKDAASKLAPVAPVLLELKEKIPSGIDMVIYIEAPRETVLQRSLGRLFDPYTGENYHFEGSLPQYDVVCKERLVRPEDPANPCSQLSLQVAAEEQSSEELKAFLHRFGTLRTVGSGSGTPDALFGKLNSVVLAMIQEAQEVDDTSTTNRAVLDNAGVAQEIGEKTDGGNNLEGGADPNNPSNVDPSATLGLAGDEPGPLERQQAEGGDEAYSAPVDGTSSSARPSVTVTGCEHQEETTRRELLTGGLAVAVSGHWRAAEQQFEGTARRVFRELRNQRLLIGSHVRFLRDSFSDFLHRADDKQTTLSDFCASFNSIEQDLRFDDRARKELLLRTEECRSSLWLDVEEREDCAAGMLRSLKEDGWLERQKGMISNHIIVLMQAEVERFHAGTTLLHDYHHIKTQEVAYEDTVVLVPLLPPDTEGTAPKDAPPPKAGGKKDKDGKGGGKKDQEGKGAKRRKSTATGGPGLLGVRTALPPCLTLPSLVEVIVAGGSLQLASEAEESGAPVGQGKGKADKNKKAPKRPTGGKADAPETEESKPPLAAALAMILNYADAWGPEGFPVPEETEEEFSMKTAASAANTAADGEPARPRKPAPSPLLLHRAVWAQADLLAKRCRVLVRAGEALSSAIQRKADLVYAELQSCLDARVLEETTAVETAMAMARDGIDRQSLIEHDWQLQGGSFGVDESVRLVPVPEIHPPYSAATEESTGVLSKSQVLRLQEALYSIRHSGRRGDEPAVVAPEDVVDALLRLSEEEGALPECWSCASKEDLMQFATGVLDPDDIGQVEVEKVVSSIASKSI